MAISCWPLEWFSMWLADESRGNRVDVKRLPNDVKYDAEISMKRRLATRTKGILEISGKMVSFLHRTARDWARESRVSDMISASSNCDIDLYMMLAEAEALGFSYPKKALDYSHDSMWEAIYKTLWYASHVQSQGQSVRQLIELLDYFDQQVLQTWLVAQQTWPAPLKLKSDQHWAEKQSRTGKGRCNTFLGITIQLAILPYVETKIRENKETRRQVTSKEWVGLLENATTGFLSFMSPDFRPNDGLPDIPAEKREAMLLFLHSQGFGRWGESIGSPLFRSVSQRLFSRRSR
ncbi:hypothetical protein RRF57_002356 [Xylaria bambusicola]|uniref:Uncharacterized protein n=1 Tax=Xylaria bambusicola TaxID=326684 RepID=A0AAN7UIM3_9PEZI